MEHQIEYRGGYKYQLYTDYQIDTGIATLQPVESRFFTFHKSGLLEISAGYAWDGPSGPTFDTRNFMRGSLVHDVFYQMFREGQLNPAMYRRPADKLLRRICKADGMWGIRAWWVYKAVRIGGPRYEKPDPKPIMKAPWKR